MCFLVFLFYGSFCARFFVLQSKIEFSDLNFIGPEVSFTLLDQNRRESRNGTIKLKLAEKINLLTKRAKTI